MRNYPLSPPPLLYPPALVRGKLTCTYLISLIKRMIPICDYGWDGGCNSKVVVERGSQAVLSSLQLGSCRVDKTYSLPPSFHAIGSLHARFHPFAHYNLYHFKIANTILLKLSVFLRIPLTAAPLQPEVMILISFNICHNIIT